MKFVYITVVLLVGVGVGWSGATHAANTPQRLVLKQGGKEKIFYRVGRDRFREVSATELLKSTKAAKVCISAKLVMRGGGTLALRDQSLSTIRFRIAKINAKAKPGDNVLVCGDIGRANGGRVFRVKALAVLPNDLAIFAKRLKALRKRENATADDYFRLAWWLQKNESVTTDIASSDLKKYKTGSDTATDHALALERANLNTTQKMIHQRVKRYQKFVASYKGKSTSVRDEGRLLAERKTFLRTHADTIAELRNPALEKTAAYRRFVANLYLYLVKVHREFLTPEKSEPLILPLLRQAGTLDPTNRALQRDLKKRGFVLYKNRWQTEAAVRKIKAQKARDRETAERAKLIAEQKNREENAIAVLRTQDTSTHIRRQVDPLLSHPTSENILELRGMLQDLPEDVARYALWQTASIADAATVRPLLNLALESKISRISEDAVALYAARGALGVTTLIKTIQAQPKSVHALSLHIVKTLGSIPSADGIQALITVLSTGSIADLVKEEAAKILRRETGQTFSADSFTWKNWWRKNAATFKRK